MDFGSGCAFGVDAKAHSGAGGLQRLLDVATVWGSGFGV
jgi:predicted Rossmann fold nucleotide-binding protein DprA/Smf involved in DNA uptake